MDKDNIQNEVKNHINNVYQKIKSIDDLTVPEEDDLKRKIDDRIQLINQKKDDIDEFYEELITVSESKFNELKADFDAKMKELNKDVQSIRERQTKN